MSWYQLQSILRDAAQEAHRENERQERKCPYDGYQLEPDRWGRWHCKYDGIIEPYR